MKVLITGANGQLGTEIRNQAENCNGCDFIFTDIAELDITNETAVNAAILGNAVDIVVNCAAYTAVDKAESNEPLARQLNASAPGLLAKAVAERGGEIIHISTDYVFDGQGCVPYTESMPTAPQSVYGLTKLAGEKAVVAATDRHIIIRTAWLYSPYGNNFVKTMLRLGRERTKLNVVYDQVGSPTCAADLAKAILKIVQTEAKTYGVFHYSNEGVISWYDFTKAIHRLAGITQCDVQPILSREYPTPAVRPAYSVLHKGKIKDTYHVAVPYWEDSLSQCIKEIEKIEATVA
ncbi:MAG: dTDP-4-dehydrorhamnose reductase [Bacteroidaceae bacterium]|nr:dTDP-4-dehydrorhamnose reductase [Bacteroidaceae bacterium]MBO4593982.1 dTDP-4-dehydrorhamnose reductase [Bacteroidaceae bacterium]MBR4783514.1 dTDP-4-dehydrorhamnose reductase [Bacteroidaceae bacterium]